MYEPQNNQSDYFVHYKTFIQSSNYPVTLRPNEYVQFEVHETEHADQNKQLKAVNVTGIAGGPLDATRMRRTKHDRHAPPARQKTGIFQPSTNKPAGAAVTIKDGEDGGGAAEEMMAAAVVLQEAGLVVLQAAVWLSCRRQVWLFCKHLRSE